MEFTTNKVSTEGLAIVLGLGCPYRRRYAQTHMGTDTVYTAFPKKLYPGIAPGWGYFFQPTKKPIYSKVKMLQTKKQETKY